MLSVSCLLQALYLGYVNQSHFYVELIIEGQAELQSGRGDQQLVLLSSVYLTVELITVRSTSCGNINRHCMP